MMDRGDLGARIAAAGVPVHALDMPRRRLTLRGTVKLFKLIRALKPDVVQTWMYHADLVGGLIARFAGCRHVVWGVRHSDHDRGSTSRSTRLVATLGAMLSGIVPAAIACCSQRAVLVHKRLGYASTKFHVIPNGYDLDRFSPDPQAGEAVRHGWGIGPGNPLIGCVARWNPQKDHANLIRALAALAGRHPRLTCVLVGGGMVPENAELMALLNDHGLAGRVVLAGQRNDVPAVMNALNLHVLASAYGEAFPNVVAEAMACGTPCVVTDVGDAAFIVGDTGLVAPPKDAGALASAVEVLILELENDADRRESRKLASRTRIAENFSMERMVEAYTALWEQVVHDRLARADGPEDKG